MRWPVALGAAALAVPAVALLGFGLTRDPREIPSPLPGRPAPTFVLAAFAGPRVAADADAPDTVRLTTLRGDVVVLNFWASWCLACRDEHAALRSVGARYANSDVHFVGVIYNDAVGPARRWLAEMGELPYPSLADPGARTGIDYGIYGVPETFFIGRDGRVARKHVGPVTEEVLVDEIETLRAAPRPRSTAGAGAFR